MGLDYFLAIVSIHRNMPQNKNFRLLASIIKTTKNCRLCNYLSQIFVNSAIFCYYLGMLKRKIDQILIDWKNKKDHNPLIVYGARQIGKTTSIREFAKNNYKSFVEINFISNPEYKDVFVSFDPEQIVNRLSLYNKDFEFIENDTLIFFDEIQSFMDVTTSLKFFKLQGKYDVICSGSSLGVYNQTISSVAVGFKEEYIMTSFDFEEFLWAKGYKQSQINIIKDNMISFTPFDKVELDVFNKLFMEYVIVGGYPRIINDYITNNNYSNTYSLSQELYKDYKDDISKYLEGLDIAKALKIYESIANQLSKENHKFQFTKLGHGARFSSFYGCTKWIENAGICLIVNNIPNLELPLQGNDDEENFRVYFSDTTLFLASLEEESLKDLLVNKNLGIYKGALYENIAAAYLYKQRYKLYFYRSKDSTIELDFLLRYKDTILPIEVKAKKGRQVSLNTALSSSNSIKQGIKFGQYNIGSNKDIITFPLFCLPFIRKYLESQTL